MGVHGGSKLLFTLAGLSFSQLSSLGRNRAENAKRPGSPAVVADISWLCHRLRKRVVGETIDLVAAFILKFIQEGFVFQAAFDPEGRHHTKKASVRREFERQQSMAICIRAKSEILSISRALREGNIPNEEEQKIVLRAQLKDLEKKVKKGEQAIDDSEYHPQIIDGVRRTVEQLALLHPGKVLIVEGKYQADSYIQHLLTTGQADLAIGNDSDFSFVAGGACLQVSAFDIKASKKDVTDIKNIMIATGFGSTMDLARSHLGSCGTYKAAELPLLDGLTDIRTPLFDCCTPGQ
jgi:hypothetical protein